MSLVQALHVLQLILLLLASFLRLRWFVDKVGDFMGNYTSSIWSKMQSIKDCVERLVFLIRWILAHGEIALLYAEDLSVYVHSRHRFHPADHRRLDEISEQDCFTWFSQNHANIRRLLLHLRVPDTFTNLSNRAVYTGVECFLVWIYHLTKGLPFTAMACFVIGGDPRHLSEI